MTYGLFRIGKGEDGFGLRYGRRRGIIANPLGMRTGQRVGNLNILGSVDEHEHQVAVSGNTATADGFVLDAVDRARELAVVEEARNAVASNNLVAVVRDTRMLTGVARIVHDHSRISIAVACNFPTTIISIRSDIVVARIPSIRLHNADVEMLHRSSARVLPVLNLIWRRLANCEIQHELRRASRIDLVYGKHARLVTRIYVAGIRRIEVVVFGCRVRISCFYPGVGRSLTRFIGQNLAVVSNIEVVADNLVVHVVRLPDGIERGIGGGHRERGRSAGCVICDGSHRRRGSHDGKRSPTLGGIDCTDAGRRSHSHLFGCVGNIDVIRNGAVFLSVDLFVALEPLLCIVLGRVRIRRRIICVREVLIGGPAIQRIARARSRTSIRHRDRAAPLNRARSVFGSGPRRTRTHLEVDREGIRLVVQVYHERIVRIARNDARDSRRKRIAVHDEAQRAVCVTGDALTIDEVGNDPFNRAVGNGIRSGCDNADVLADRTALLLVVNNRRRALARNRGNLDGVIDVARREQVHKFQALVAVDVAAFLLVDGLVMERDRAESGRTLIAVGNLQLGIGVACRSVGRARGRPRLQLFHHTVAAHDEATHGVMRGCLGRPYGVQRDARRTGGRVRIAGVVQVVTGSRGIEARCPAAKRVAGKFDLVSGRQGYLVFGAVHVAGQRLVARRPIAMTLVLRVVLCVAFRIEHQRVILVGLVIQPQHQAAVSGHGAEIDGGVIIAMVGALAIRVAIERQHGSGIERGDVGDVVTR